MAETKKKTKLSEAPAAPEVKTPAKRGRKPKAETMAAPAAPEALGDGPIVESVKESIEEAKEAVEAIKAKKEPATEKKAGVVFTVNAPTGLRLRMSPPKNTQAISGVGGGYIMTVMPLGSKFRELKRDKKWSYGIYEIEGKELSGWTCNQYLRK